MRTLNPVVGLACAGALALSFAGTALAHEQSKARTASPPRVVMQCVNDAATRRAFTREHGAAPVFVTARDVRAARSSGETWATPRCMTAREHARLVQSMTDMAAVR
jgi:hypothetical protein